MKEEKQFDNSGYPKDFEYLIIKKDVFGKFKVNSMLIFLLLDQGLKYLFYKLENQVTIRLNKIFLWLTFCDLKFKFVVLKSRQR